MNQSRCVSLFRPWFTRFYLGVNSEHVFCELNNLFTRPTHVAPWSGNIDRKFSRCHYQWSCFSHSVNGFLILFTPRLLLHDHGVDLFNGGISTLANFVRLNWAPGNRTPLFARAP